MLNALNTNLSSVESQQMLMMSHHHTKIKVLFMRCCLMHRNQHRTRYKNKSPVRALLSNAQKCISDLLDMASLVDPRFRDKYIPSENINAVKNQAVMKAESLMADQDSCQPDPGVPSVPTPTDQVAIMPPTAKSSSSSLASRAQQPQSAQH